MDNQSQNDLAWTSAEEETKSNITIDRFIVAQTPDTLLKK
jgi:hypothetical protein